MSVLSSIPKFPTQGWLRKAKVSRDGYLLWAKSKKGTLRKKIIRLELEWKPTLSVSHAVAWASGVYGRQKNVNKGSTFQEDA